MTKEKPMRCIFPDCDFVGKTKQDWIDHLKKNHPEVKSLQFGTETINLED